MSIIHFLRDRTCGHSRSGTAFSADVFPRGFRERRLTLGHSDKVFASVWLSKFQLLLGTKENELLVYDLKTSRCFNIPSIERPGFSSVSVVPGGIHSISKNPSGTLLATGGQNVSDVAFYRLPELEPCAVGQGHEDWLFCSSWITDDILLSGSRDARMLVWSAEWNKKAMPACCVTSHANMLSPQESMNVMKSRIRAMSCCRRRLEVAVLSPSGGFGVVDVASLKRTHLVSLGSADHVCLAINDDESLYASGSLHGVTLVDANGGHPLWTLSLPRGCANVRSLLFHEHTLVIGCGTGQILFCDIRKRRLLMKGSELMSLSAKGGYLRRDIAVERYFPVWSLGHAVYTMALDSEGSQFLAAGGPLNAVLCGNFASVWA